MYSGLYINLDRSCDRRERLERDIARIGLAGRYRRIPAVDGASVEPRARLAPAEFGCYLSHLQALAAASESTTATHVLEDDTILSPRLPSVISAAIECGLLDQFDIVFLDFGMPYDPRLLAHYKKIADPGRISVISIGGCKFWGTASYLVSPRGAARIADVCRKAMDDWPLPIDVIICEQARAGALRSAALFPFVTTVHLEQSLASTIGHEFADDDLGHLIFGLLRYSFFVDADLSGYAQPFITTARRMISAAPDRPMSKAATVMLDLIRAVPL